MRIFKKRGFKSQVEQNIRGEMFMFVLIFPLIINIAEGIVVKSNCMVIEFKKYTFKTLLFTSKFIYKYTIQVKCQ